MFEPLVYLLCFFTSFVAMLLLARAYMSNRSRLLMWSALAFVALAVSNLVLFVDIVLLPNISLLWMRELSSAVGVCVLLYGFIWELD